VPEANTEQRKLAAIMFTDMVGYSALAQRNEALALELLEAHRVLVRGILPTHSGREVKTTGDGFLIEFPSALAAVQCAIDVQAALHTRNLAQPEDRQACIRIGIHVGDVVARDGDVHGDGVNLAARIEPLAPPGGICLSRQAHDQVAGKLEAQCARLGQAELKNITGLFEVYRVVLPWQRGAPPRLASRRMRAVQAAVPWTLTFALAIALAVVLLGARRDPSRAAVPSIRYLTYSGRDYSPSASADGKRICFSSDRDGTNRIWVKEIASGWETALTSGPDDFPRFSRDGSAVLFTRMIGNKRSLFRIPAIGGEPFRIIDDAVAGDWSPDGRQVAFARWSEDGSSSIYTAGSDGSAQALLHRFPDARCSAPRWSPDAAKIAVTFNQSGHHQSVAWIDIANQQLRTLTVPNDYNVLSTVVWDHDSRSILYLQAESAQGDTSGSPAALFRQRLDSGQFQKLLWCPAYCAVIDLLPNGNMLMDAKSSRQNLKEYELGSSNSAPRSLTLGGSTDRQPAYSPDGKQIVFSSNRSGNLEIWSVSRDSGTVRRLTDHPADDWDPAISPDGRYLIWSAKRTGNLEVWMANADGSAPMQVTHEGFAAQNPTMTSDGRWIVYSSYNLQRPGIWKIHPDGSADTALVRRAAVGNAEVCPDGRYAAYRDYSNPSFVAIKVVDVESGAAVPFEISVTVIKGTTARLARVRWMPDGKALAFLGQDERAVTGVYVQDFIPGQDTSKTRRPLVPFDPQNSAESFGISPDGRFITIACWEQFFSIMRTEDLAGP